MWYFIFDVDFPKPTFCKSFEHLRRRLRRSPWGWRKDSTAGTLPEIIIIILTQFQTNINDNYCNQLQIMIGNTVKNWKRITVNKL